MHTEVSAASGVASGRSRSPSTCPYIGEGIDWPALETLCLAAPVAFKGRLVHHDGRILRPFSGKTTAEVHDYHHVATGVLASSVASPVAPSPPSTSTSGTPSRTSSRPSARRASVYRSSSERPSRAQRLRLGPTGAQIHRMASRSLVSRSSSQGASQNPTRKSSREEVPKV